MSYVGSILSPSTPIEEWPIVTCNGKRYRVAPVPILPVAESDLPFLCETWGCGIPSVELVDAIWRAADLRLDPGKVRRSPNDYANGASPQAYAKQKAKIEALIDGQPFTLLAGVAKDFVVQAGVYKIYGFHTRTGEVVQPANKAHAKSFHDYSQGFRVTYELEGEDDVRPHHCVLEEVA